MLAEKKKDRWKLEEGGICWNLDAEKELPHDDHLEMSGKYVSQYVKYKVDRKKRFRWSRSWYGPGFGCFQMIPTPV